MFYRFNPLANRIISATHVKAYHPQGLVPMSKVKETQITSMYQPVATSPAEILPEGQVRQSSTTSTPLTTPPRKSGSRYAPLDPRIKELQELFQKPDGVPVHLKRGGLDRLMFMTTIGLGVAGCGWVIFDIVNTAFPH